MPLGSLAHSPLILALLVGAASAQVEPGEHPAWDQEAAAALARQLAEDTQGIRQAFRREPPATVVSGESRARFRLLDLLRRIERETRFLASELEAGRGHDETLPVYENLLGLVRDAQEERRRIFLQSQTLERIEVARGHLEQLDPFYDQTGRLPAPVR